MHGLFQVSGLKYHSRTCPSPQFHTQNHNTHCCGRSGQPACVIPANDSTGSSLGLGTLALGFRSNIIWERYPKQNGPGWTSNVGREKPTGRYRGCVALSGHTSVLGLKHTITDLQKTRKDTPCSRHTKECPAHTSRTITDHAQRLISWANMSKRRRQGQR